MTICQKSTAHLTQIKLPRVLLLVCSVKPNLHFERMYLIYIYIYVCAGQLGKEYRLWCTTLYRKVKIAVENAREAAPAGAT